MMTVFALVVAALASLIHVYIFVMESLIWTGPRARKTFGTTVEDAATTKSLAFNQGFYNLFLAVVTAIGIVLFAGGTTAVGAALVFTGAGSMVLAGIVLLLSSPDKRRAALIQLVPPLVAVVALLIAISN
jgi:putative membrane protein